jgi:hypothetical protein
MRIGHSRWVVGFLTGALLLASGAAAFADHHDGNGQDIRGVVTAFTLTASGNTGTTTTGSGSSNSSATVRHQNARRWDGGSAWTNGTAVGSLTVLSPTAGSVTLTVLSTTRFEVTGAALASGLVGSSVNVQALMVGTTLDARQVEVSNDAAEAMQLKGVVTAIAPGTITLMTDNGATVTAVLDSQVTVTIGDGQAGTLQDVTVGSRIRATWQVTDGQMDIVSIHVLGQGDQGQNGQNGHDG